VITGVATPLGSFAVDDTTSGDSVSTTTRFVAVAVPTFATTIRYFTAWPGSAGDAAGNTCSLVCVSANTGPVTVNTVDVKFTAVVAHALPPAV
jgi:hypothetical protein